MATVLSRLHILLENIRPKDHASDFACKSRQHNSSTLFMVNKWDLNTQKVKKNLYFKFNSTIQNEYKFFQPSVCWFKKKNAISGCLLFQILFFIFLNKNCETISNSSIHYQDSDGNIMDKTETWQVGVKTVDGSVLKFQIS